jgi:hypothetical protein
MGNLPQRPLEVKFYLPFPLGLMYHLAIACPTNLIGCQERPAMLATTPQKGEGQPVSVSDLTNVLQGIASNSKALPPRISSTD